jgi:UPF0716 family protein affecting phage T7 exclusion
MADLENNAKHVAAAVVFVVVAAGSLLAPGFLSYPLFH